MHEITEINANLNSNQYNQEILKTEVAGLTKRTADEVLSKKIEEEIQKMPRSEGGIPQQILDEIQRQAVKQDMCCLMIKIYRYVIEEEKPQGDFGRICRMTWIKRSDGRSTRGC